MDSIKKERMIFVKTVFVTGADMGLGLGLVKKFLTNDYKVFAGQYLGTSIELEKLVSENKDNLIPIKIDISKDESVKQAASEIKKHINYLDLLFNCAGILGDIEKTIMDELDFDKMLDVINVNSLGPIRVINSLVDLVLNSKTKTIVNISSEAGSISNNFRDAWFGYCMSKTALNMGSTIIQNKIISQKGRVILVHPGWIKSYMHGYLNNEADYTPEEAAEKIINTIEKEMQNEIKSTPVYIDLNGNTLNW
jgi:NAD(P)-dependent dehydrogenase (short-subunit alcohol dehydrogenase family)